MLLFIYFHFQEKINTFTPVSCLLCQPLRALSQHHSRPPFSHPGRRCPCPQCAARPAWMLCGPSAWGSAFCLPNTDTCCSCEGIPAFPLIISLNANFLRIFVDWETSKLLCPGKTREIANSDHFKLDPNGVQMLSCAC